MSRFKLWWITVFIVLLDQATKLRIRHKMDIGDSFSVLGDYFRITYVTNTGGAFSFSIGDGSYNQLFFITANVIAMAMLIFLLSKSDKLITAIAYLMVLGGALGNLIDRIAYGSVVDFLDLKFFSFIMDRWPVFNVADSAVTVAVIILVIDIIFIRDIKPEIEVNTEQV